MYEITDEQPYVHFLTEYRTAVPANGVALLPKTMYNVRNVEIARWLKLCGDFVEPVSFTVPRTRVPLWVVDLLADCVVCRWSCSKMICILPQQIGANLLCLLMSGVLAKRGHCPQSACSLQIWKLCQPHPPKRKTRNTTLPQNVPKRIVALPKRRLVGPAQQLLIVLLQLLSSYYNKMSGEHGETQDKVLKQDLMEGVAAEEWD